MTKKDMEARRTALMRFLSAEYDPDTVMLDGPEFDGGIVGVASVPAGQGTRRCRLVYSYMKLAAALAASTGWSWNDAVEWIEYNTIRSLPYLGTGRRS